MLEISAFDIKVSDYPTESCEIFYARVSINTVTTKHCSWLPSPIQCQLSRGLSSLMCIWIMRYHYLFENEGSKKMALHRVVKISDGMDLSWIESTVAPTI